MSRLLLMIVAVVMPLQAVMAMATGYCELESSPTAHPKLHATAPADHFQSQGFLDGSGVGSVSQEIPSQPDGNIAFSGHHCSSCHLSCFGVMTAPDLNYAAPILDVLSPSTHLVFFFPPPHKDRLERPKWSDLA
jgi:hypothetical protein